MGFFRLMLLCGAFYLAALPACGGGGGSEGSSQPSEDSNVSSVPQAGEGAGVIFSDDFESSRPVAERYFEYDDADGSFVRAAGAGVGGSYGMKAVWQPGQVSAGSLKRSFGRVPAGLGYPSQGAAEQDFREIYWRLYLRNEPGWTGSPDKLSRAVSFGSQESWAEAAAAHVWSSGSVLVIDPASGISEDGRLVTTAYNDAGNMRWLGAVYGRTPVFDPQYSGLWFCIEAHVKFNDPGTSNGMFELWIDGNLEAREDGLNWTSSWTEYGINAVFVENYWNAGAPAERIRYFDNFAISTAPIGCY